MQVPIRKQQKNEQTYFVVPAVAIAVAGGDRRLIPNPAGNEVCMFNTLEEARSAIERAGFDASYEGVTTVNMSALGRPKQPALRPPRLTTTLNEQVRQKMLQLLADREPQVVIAAVDALASWQYQPAIDPLCKQLGNSDPVVRKQVAEALAKMSVFSLPALKETYRQATGSIEPNAPYIRASILSSMQAMLMADPPHDMAELLPTILLGLADEHWLVRSQAALAAAHLSMK